MKRLSIISLGLLMAVGLWTARPRFTAPCPLYRGFVEARATGAWLFSIVEAVGEYASENDSASRPNPPEKASI